MASTDGLELFAARARALGTEVNDDESARELCERLDNLPLALELAAARTKLFTPAQLLERLGQRLDLFKGGRDADPRQRTLRAAIEWSYDLLTPEEQQLFARLSVFAGGCTYGAAARSATRTRTLCSPCSTRASSAGAKGRPVSCATGCSRPFGSSP